MEPLDIAAKLHEVIQTKSYEQVRLTTDAFSSEELKRALRIKYKEEKPSTGLFEISILVLQRALPSNSKRATLATIDIFDVKNRSKYWRILFDLLDAFLTRGSQHVKAKELARELEPMKPYLDTMPIDLCQLIDKPKYIVAALLLGADPGRKSEDSWLSKIMTSHTLQSFHKQQLLERLVDLELLTKNILPVKIWSKLSVEGTINCLDSLIAPDLNDVDNETGNNALHYAFKINFPEGAKKIHATFNRLSKDKKIFVDLLLQPNLSGLIPLTIALKSPHHLWLHLPQEVSMAFREISLKKDVENLRRVFSTFSFSRRTYVPSLSLNKTLLLLMHECGLRHEFLESHGILNADLMFEVERLHISYNNRDTKNEPVNNGSKFNFEDLPSEIAFHIASFMNPFDVFSLFTVTKSTAKLLRATNREKFWRSVNETYFAPNQNQWLGSSHKTQSIQALKSSRNWQNQKYKVLDTTMRNMTPLLMDENCLVLWHNQWSVVFWDCHSQEIFAEAPKCPNPTSRFKPTNILKQTHSKEIPTLLGDIMGDAFTAVLRDGQYYNPRNLFSTRNSTVIDENTILLNTGEVYDLTAEESSETLKKCINHRTSRFSYNPFNRTVIASNDERNGSKMLIFDLNGKKVAEYQRDIRHHIFYPIDEYTMLYNAYGGSDKSKAHSLGHIDLRTGKDIVRIDGLLYCTLYSQPRIVTSERLLFYNASTRLQTSWNLRLGRWEYVEETGTYLCANTRYSVHHTSNVSGQLEIRDYCSI